ncbi:DUF874 family protein, partial [Helicobacter pylori]|uniref:DUF874 family protein n=1 Tax=Helicobacter pylori TaxID=210 RepID=UPI001F5307AE
MESVKTGKTNKVGKNTEITSTKANKETHFKQASTITNMLRSIGGFFTKIAKKVRELVKKIAEGIGMISAAFYPKPVIVRTSDFKSN